MTPLLMLHCFFLVVITPKFYIIMITISSFIVTFQENNCHLSQLNILAFFFFLVTIMALHAHTVTANQLKER